MLASTGAAAALVLAAGSAAPDAAAGAGSPNGAGTRTTGNEQCTFPAKPIRGTPWALQRVLLDQLWQDTRGRGVTVAVIDTGVDDSNDQLRDAVDPDHGLDLIEKKGDGTNDLVGHGTKVAGIIAAREAEGTGFVGLAPEATIMPIRQNDGQRNGTASNMATAIRHAVDEGAGVINISQDTTKPLRNDSVLAQAVQYAVQKDVVVVASAGNDGADGKARNTYPAALPGVLAVGASDRNNERATFSQAGEFVGVTAPGVDMVSTVPLGGHCVDNGTSFSAPYVAGVAALLRAKHPDWKNNEVIAQIQQTAQRTALGHDRFVGWGVVDPVKALTEDDRPLPEPVPDTGLVKSSHEVVPRPLTLGETPQERKERIAVYTVAAGGAGVALLVGGSVALRDWRRRKQ
ncbi:type VII secretion-associated serine protease mycosin [Wenjunlia vitaminophila]|uniref:Type VII secretion-associated serine protease mycosin n=1 Tax=Wenjunlia vitaminophila TaxID=76728 RepID=A0A0T6LYB8_WENVI|nr:type VII secretion-associated serine protease mycosin [Wenjunlia vitaminophila]KRV51050.1 type VII secretion-associated serine protease mycosin [Wenjunlia vitaminophila]